jgi:hypothetical protein
MTPHRGSVPSSLLPLTLFLALLSGCAAGSAGVSASGADPSSKLSPFAYYEDGDLFIGVDTRAARYVEKGGIFPLGVGLANRTQQQERLGLESFSIETAEGSRYPPVTYEEYRRDYSRSRSDQRLADLFLEQLTLRFTPAFNFATWRPYPIDGEAGAANPVLQLGPQHWTHSYLYFPLPADGIHGKVFNLLVRPEDDAQTYVVRFRID